MIYAHFQLLAAWAFTALVLAGAGSLARRAARAPLGGLGDFLMDAWLGWVLLLGLLQCWNLAAGINEYAWLAFEIPGAIGAALWLRARGWTRPAWGALALWLVASATVANVALSAPKHYDAGLYHLNAIHWAAALPVTPGLGNLQYRLGYNSSHFLYGALWEARKGALGPHFINGGLLCILLAQGVLGGWRVLRGRAVDWPARDFFLALVLPGALDMARINVHSPAPDMPVFILEVVIAALALGLLCAPRESLSLPRARFEMFSLFVLCAGLLSVKLSAVAFAAAAALLVGARWLARGGSWRPVFAATALGAVLIIPWLARGIMLSGYPFYPSTFAAQDVDWRVPSLVARMDARVIRAWAFWAGRPPEHPTGRWDWLPHWIMNALRVEHRTIIIPSLLAVGGLAWMRAGRARLPRGAWLFLLIPLSGGVFWSVMAPHPRYPGAVFWIAAAGTLALAASAQSALPGFNTRLLLAAIVFTCVAASIKLPWVLKPGANGGFEPVTPQYPLRTVTNTHGVTIQIPADPHEDRSYGASLTATDAPRPNLMFRDGRSLRGGFKDATLEPMR